MSVKMNYYIDFDNTLYNTPLLVKRLQNANENEVENIILHSSDLVFKDAIPFLQKLRAENHNIFLLSHATDTLKYQSLKITGSGLTEFFDALFITSKPKYELDIDYANGIFIDDNPNDLIGLYSKNAKRVIRLRRPENKYSIKDLENVNIEEIKEQKEDLEKKIDTDITKNESTLINTPQKNINKGNNNSAIINTSNSLFSKSFQNEQNKNNNFNTIINRYDNINFVNEYKNKILDEGNEEIKNNLNINEEIKFNIDKNISEIVINNEENENSSNFNLKSSDINISGDEIDLSTWLSNARHHPISLLRYVQEPSRNEGNQVEQRHPVQQTLHHFLEH